MAGHAPPAAAAPRPREPVVIERLPKGLARVLTPEWAVETVECWALQTQDDVALGAALDRLSAGCRHLGRCHLAVVDGKRELLAAKPTASIEKLPWSPALVAQLLDNVCRGLARLHAGVQAREREQPLVLAHSDVCAASVVLDGGVFRLCSVRSIAFAGSQPEPEGNNRRWSPELWSGMSKSNIRASDVWSLAVSVLELLFKRDVGVIPPEDLLGLVRQQAAHERFVRALGALTLPCLHALAESTPRWFAPICALLSRMLEPDARTRITAPEVTELLDAVFVRWRDAGVLALPAFLQPLHVLPPAKPAAGKRVSFDEHPHAHSHAHPHAHAYVAEAHALPNLAERLDPTAHARAQQHAQYGQPPYAHHGAQQPPLAGQAPGGFSWPFAHPGAMPASAYDLDLGLPGLGGLGVGGAPMPGFVGGAPSAFGGHGAGGVAPDLHFFNMFDNLKLRPGATMPAPPPRGYEGFRPGVAPGHGAPPVPLGKLNDLVDSFLDDPANDLGALFGGRVRREGPGMRDVARQMAEGKHAPYHAFAGEAPLPGNVDAPPMPAAAPEPSMPPPPPHNAPLSPKPKP